MGKDARVEHNAEAVEIFSNGEAYALGYVIGVLDDIVNGPEKDRQWSRERARELIIEWASKHPGSPTAKKVAARGGR